MKWMLGVGGTLGVAALVAWAVLQVGGAADPADEPASRPSRAKVVRKPILAGAWYEGSITELARQADRLLGRAAAQPLPSGRPVYLIQPHAGYIYSGRAAATGLKSIREFAYDRVFILAPTHRAAFRGASIPAVTHYATPLGEVPLDGEVCAALLKHPDINTVAGAHAREHSIEIQLPLLQWTFGEHLPLEKFKGADAVSVPFKIVPILLGECTAGQVDAIAAAIKPHVGPRTLVVVSSDFTHYGRDFGYVPFTADIKKNLADLDGRAVKHIVAKDTAGFEKYLRETRATICGRVPIRAMLRMLPADAAGKQLIYYTSGDVTSVWSNSVSYVSLVFCVPEKPSAEKDLSKPERESLLKLARATLERWVREQRIADVTSAGVTLTPRLRETRGVFVTLRREGKLRGCIGYVVGVKPVYQGVIDNAISAASRDRRFKPVAPDELAKIHVEVSVMSPLERITDPGTVRVGKHGLVMRRGQRQGLLLPQVATKQGWTREQFLVAVCRKAGLPADAWRTADLFVFTAQVFGEED